MRRLLSLLLILPAPAFAEAPRVVTDVAPVHALVSMVMDGVGTPTLLVDGVADPHAFQLRPAQAAELESAGAIFWVGPGMTPWMGRLVDGLGANALSVELAELPGIEERTPMFGGHDEDEHDDHMTGEDHDAHEEEEHAEHEEEGHDHGDEDPHIWLDPMNAKVIVSAVAETLSDLDPENAARYSANAENARTALDALDAELAAILQPTAARPVIVYHDAYAHFAGRYGLTIVGALAEGDAAEPGAKQVADLRALIAANNAECVFAEALHSDRLIQTLTDGLPVPVGRLDPEGSSLTPGPEVYAAMMRGLAQAYAACSA